MGHAVVDLPVLTGIFHVEIYSQLTSLLKNCPRPEFYFLRMLAVRESFKESSAAAPKS